MNFFTLNSTNSGKNLSTVYDNPNVAISHAAKKLVRLIYAMEKSGQQYNKRGCEGVINLRV